MGVKMEITVGDVLKGKKLVGGLCGNYKTRTGIQQLVNKYCANDLPIDPMITHRIPLDQINNGFAKLAMGQTIRTVIQF